MKKSIRFGRLHELVGKKTYQVSSVVLDASGANRYVRVYLTNGVPLAWISNPADVEYYYSKAFETSSAWVTSRNRTSWVREDNELQKEWYESVKGVTRPKDLSVERKESLERWKTDILEALGRGVKDQVEELKGGGVIDSSRLGRWVRFAQLRALGVYGVGQPVGKEETVRQGVGPSALRYEQIKKQTEVIGNLLGKRENQARYRLSGRGGKAYTQENRLVVVERRAKLWLDYEIARDLWEERLWNQVQATARSNKEIESEERYPLAEKRRAWILEEDASRIKERWERRVVLFPEVKVDGRSVWAEALSSKKECCGYWEKRRLQLWAQAEIDWERKGKSPEEQKALKRTQAARYEAQLWATEGLLLPERYRLELTKAISEADWKERSEEEREAHGKKRVRKEAQAEFRKKELLAALEPKQTVRTEKSEEEGDLGVEQWPIPSVYASEWKKRQTSWNHGLALAVRARRRERTNRIRWIRTWREGAKRDKQPRGAYERKGANLSGLPYIEVVKKGGRYLWKAEDHYRWDKVIGTLVQTKREPSEVEVHTWQRARIQLKEAYREAIGRQQARKVEDELVGPVGHRRWFVERRRKRRLTSRLIAYHLDQVLRSGKKSYTALGSVFPLLLEPLQKNLVATTKERVAEQKKQIFDRVRWEQGESQLVYTSEVKAALKAHVKKQKAWFRKKAKQVTYTLEDAEKLFEYFRERERKAAAREANQKPSGQRRRGLNLESKVGKVLVRKRWNDSNQNGVSSGFAWNNTWLKSLTKNPEEVVAIADRVVRTREGLDLIEDRTPVTAPERVEERQWHDALYYGVKARQIAREGQAPYQEIQEVILATLTWDRESEGYYNLYELDTWVQWRERQKLRRSEVLDQPTEDLNVLSEVASLGSKEEVVGKIRELVSLESREERVQVAIRLVFGKEPQDENLEAEAVCRRVGWIPTYRTYPLEERHPYQTDVDDDRWLSKTESTLRWYLKEGGELKRSEEVRDLWWTEAQKAYFTRHGRPRGYVKGLQTIVTDISRGYGDYGVWLSVKEGARRSGKDLLHANVRFDRLAWHRGELFRAESRNLTKCLSYGTGWRGYPHSEAGTLVSTILYHEHYDRYIQVWIGHKAKTRRTERRRYHVLGQKNTSLKKRRVSSPEVEGLFSKKTRLTSFQVTRNVFRAVNVYRKDNLRVRRRTSESKGVRIGKKR